MQSKNLVLRIASALVLGTTILITFFVSTPAFLVIVGIVAGMALYEWLLMSRSQVWLSVAGVIYIIFCVGCFTALTPPDLGLNTLYLLIIVWACDIGAYAMGRLIGGPLLIPRISPKKTWAGAAGGLIFPVVIALAAVSFGGDTDARVFVITAAITIIIALAAQVGDLIESAAKRYFGIKDSGWLMPGHGGILDRIDGLLLAAPVALLLSSVFGTLL